MNSRSSSILFCDIYGSGPWRNHLNIDRIGKCGNEEEKAMVGIIDKIILMVDEYIWSHDNPFIYDKKESSFIYNKIKSKIEWWDHNCQKLIDDYTNWMMWHEGFQR